jgi:pSer/pThr/pTyr-binding forkhead associated (FHA) protein
MPDKSWVEQLDRVSIGLFPCDIVFNDDPYISGHHATMVRAPGGPWYIGDAGSTNGLRVNNVRVWTLQTCRPQDRFTFSSRTSYTGVQLVQMAEEALARRGGG